MRDNESIGHAPESHLQDDFVLNPNLLPVGPPSLPSSISVSPPAPTPPPSPPPPEYLTKAQLSQRLADLSLQVLRQGQEYTRSQIEGLYNEMQGQVGEIYDELSRQAGDLHTEFHHVHHRITTVDTRILTLHDCIEAGNARTEQQFGAIQSTLAQLMEWSSLGTPVASGSGQSNAHPSSSSSRPRITPSATGGLPEIGRAHV